MLCRKAEMLPIECIVRGYLTGSAWKEYRRDGHHARHDAARRPARVDRSCPSRSSPRRPRPTVGDHDENISFDAAVDLVGTELAERARDVCARALPPGRRVGRRAGHHHRRHQVRARADGRRRAAVLADEVLTPDSSRFWPADQLGARHDTPRRSTSSRCATSSTTSTGTSARRPRRCPPTSSRPPPPATSRPTSASPAARFADWPGVGLSVVRRTERVRVREASRARRSSP